jgi:N-acetylmuramoyl-L-alanine amidase
MNSRKLTFNGVLIWMNDPLAENGSGWSLDKNDVTRIVDPLLRPDRTLVSTNLPIVVIDAGHGGNDTGATGRRISEKRAVLDIAYRIRKSLQSANIDVKLTREKDTTLTLEERSTTAHKMGATLFVSIHMNSAETASACGLETYVMPAPGFASAAGGNGHDRSWGPGNRFDASNILLAYHIHHSVLAKTGATDRGIKHARFDVLAQAPCPAVLIECGFLSNAYEEEMISMKHYREVLSEGIAQGLMAYITNTKISR